MPLKAHVTAPRPIASHLHTPDNLGTMLAEAVTKAPARTALICGEHRLDYSTLGHKVADLAGTIHQQINKGDMVAVVIANSPECVIAALACMVAGARVVPVNPFYPSADLGKLFIETPRLILCVGSTLSTAQALSDSTGCQTCLNLDSYDFGTAPQASDTAAALSTLSADLAPTDAALLIFTGGTTGRSKAVEHSHGALIQSVRQHCTVWELRYDVETILNVAPLFHIWAFGFAMLAPLYLRSTLVLLERYVPEKVLAAIGEHRVTVFAGGPAPIYYGLLNCLDLSATDFTSLQIALTGGASCPQALKDSWKEAADSQLLEGWGMSEGAPLCLNWRSHSTPNLSVGQPVPETEIQIVDLEDDQRILDRNQPGEVLVRGPQLMTAYRLQSGEPDLSLRNGWLYTGDIGFIDDNGFLSLVDRKKDVIIVGGYNVYPREVEDTLRAHPAIKDIAVVGQKDDYLGETPVAFFISDEASASDVLMDYCKEAFVKYKRPARFIQLDEFPRTGPGKINKIALREMLRA